MPAKVKVKKSWVPKVTPSGAPRPAWTNPSDEDSLDDAVAGVVGAATSPTAAATASAAVDPELDSLVTALISVGSGDHDLGDFQRRTGLSKTYIRMKMLSVEVNQRLESSDLRATLEDGSIIRVQVTAPASAAATTTAAAPIPTPPPVVEEFETDEDYFHFDPIVTPKIKAFIKKCRNIWLHGETGTGKTELYERLLDEAGQAYYKVSFNEESSIDDLIGGMRLVGGDTEYNKGPLIRAMEDGVPLICEEIDAAPSGANLIMQRVLEQQAGKARRFLNPITSEEIEAKAGFCVLATANTAGAGDHTGLYAGVQVQNAAFRDRFVFDTLSYPPADVETMILRKRTGIDKGIAERIIKFAEAVRQAVKNGEGLTPVSTRTVIAFGMAFSDLDDCGFSESDQLREALRSSIVEKASNPADKAAMLDLAQRLFGIRIK
jgi:cobaltochelatase CobS